MAILQTVAIKAHTDVYGQTGYAIVTAGDGYVVRAEIGSYSNALEIAKRIDERNLDPEAKGWGGIELS